MINISRVGQGARNFGRIGLVLLMAGMAWMGVSAKANAMDLTYAAYRMDAASTLPVKQGDWVGSGDRLLIKIKYLNDSAMVARPGFVVFTLPEGCAFVDAQRTNLVEVSVDGGETFGRLDRLKISQNGRLRPAIGADVTQVRLVLDHPIASGDSGEIHILAVRN